MSEELDASIKDNAAKAEAEYDEFSKHQRIVSDFDREIERLIAGGDSNE